MRRPVPAKSFFSFRGFFLFFRSAKPPLSPPFHPHSCVSDFRSVPGGCSRFIHAMGMRLRGRDFTWSDGPHGERIVVINASAARIYWPGEDPVGKILMRGKEEDRVVGVVNDVHEENVESGTGSQIYYPAMQQGPSGAQLVVRTSLPPATLAASVLHALRELNPRQPAAEFRPIRTIVERAVSPRRFFMLLVATFASLGLLLAALGIYGVISYSVTRQTPEWAIFIAAMIFYRLPSGSRRRVGNTLSVLTSRCWWRPTSSRWKC